MDLGDTIQSITDEKGSWGAHVKRAEFPQGGKVPLMTDKDGFEGSWSSPWGSPWGSSLMNHRRLAR